MTTVVVVGCRESTCWTCYQDLFVPTFCVRDSTQVAPFLAKWYSWFVRTPSRGRGGGFGCGSSPWTTWLSSCSSSNWKYTRHCTDSCQAFVIASSDSIQGTIVVAIGCIFTYFETCQTYIVACIQGRLPMNNHSIAVALELGITDCLASLQKTSPGLLLTSTQLKETIRDSRYVPALSAALANVVCKSQNTQLQASMVQTIQKWLSNTTTESTPDEMQQRQDDDGSNRSEEQMVPRVISMDSSPSESASMQDDDDDDDVTHASTGAENVSAVTLCPLLERRLRLVCAPKKRSCRPTRRSTTKRKPWLG